MNFQKGIIKERFTEKELGMKFYIGKKCRLCFLFDTEFNLMEMYIYYCHKRVCS